MGPQPAVRLLRPAAASVGHFACAREQPRLSGLRCVPAARLLFAAEGLPPVLPPQQRTRRRVREAEVVLAWPMLRLDPGLRRQARWLGLGADALFSNGLAFWSERRPCPGSAAVAAVPCTG